MRLWPTLLTLSACASNTASVAPPSAGFVVPPGCEKNQGGIYKHAENGNFGYVAQDDGDTLILRVARSTPEGGEIALSPHAPTVVLKRTPQGFWGSTLARAFVGSRECPVEFPTQVIGCSDEALILRTTPSTAVDEACHGPSRPSVPTQTQKLLREKTVSAPPDKADAG